MLESKSLKITNCETIKKLQTQLWRGPPELWNSQEEGT